jgi:hypothetical protein
LEISEAGAVAFMTQRADGLLALVLPDSPPVGTGWVARPSRAQLALPGDRVAFLSGRVSSLAEPACVAAAELVLAGLTDAGGAQTARSLLSLVCGEGAAAVSLLEIAEAPKGS